MVSFFIFFLIRFKVIHYTIHTNVFIFLGWGWTNFLGQSALWFRFILWLKIYWRTWVIFGHILRVTGVSLSLRGHPTSCLQLLGRSRKDKERKEKSVKGKKNTISSDERPFYIGVNILLSIKISGQNFFVAFFYFFICFCVSVFRLIFATIYW